MPKTKVSANINQRRATSTTGVTVVSGGAGGGTQPGTLTGATTNTVTSAGLHYHAVQLPHASLLGIAADDHHDPVTVGNTGLSLSTQQLSLALAATSGLQISSGLMLADTIAGAGLTIASKILAVGQGDGLTVSADAVALTTPGTLTVASSNAAAGNHTHAITSSSNPGAAASILASDASGYLQLVRLGLGTAPSYPLHVSGDAVVTQLGVGMAPTVPLDVTGAVHIDGDLTFTGAQSIATSADSLTLAPVSNLDLDPGSNLVRATDGVSIGTDNYVSQTTGWRASYAGGGDFRYLFADELHAKSFITDLEQALAGGQIICKSVAVVATDFLIPESGFNYLVVEDLPGAIGVPVFQDGDIVRLRQFTRTEGGLTIADAWGAVSSYTDAGGGLQTWIWVRSAGAAGGTASGTIAAKTLALDYGTTGNGFYEVNAIDGAWAENSPYAQIVTWATHPQSGQTVRSRWGNLKGIFSVANEYGLYAGDGVVDASKYLRISSQTVEAHNLPIKMYDGASVTLQLDPTAPSLAMGSTLPSAYGTGDGLWMGKDTVYKFRVGDVDGELLAWDGTNFYLKADASNYLKATGTSLEFYANATKVIDIANTPSVTIGQVAAGQGNVLISSGAVALRVNTTETIKLLSTGAAQFGQVATDKGNMYWNPSNDRLEFRGSTDGTVVQAYVDTDGSIVGGGGNVALNSGGIEIVASSIGDDSISWLDSGGNRVGAAYGYAGISGSIAVLRSEVASDSADAALAQLSAHAGSVLYNSFVTCSGVKDDHNNTYVGLYPENTATLVARASGISISVDTTISGGLNLGTATGAGVGDIKASGGFVGALRPGRTDKTIAAGVITVTAGETFLRIDTEGGAATDDLDTINGGTLGHILIIQSRSSGRTVVVKHGTGNIQCGGADVTLNHPRDKLMLIYDSDSAYWLSLAPMGNNA